jgi:hypothetical protein
VASEQELVRGTPRLEAAVNAAERKRIDLEKAVAGLPLKASEAKVKAHAAASDALQKLRDAVAAAEKRTRALGDIKSELARQLRGAEAAWIAMQESYPGVLDQPTWNRLKLRTDAAGHKELDRRIAEARAEVEALREGGLSQIGKEGSNRLGGLKQLTDAREVAAKDLGLDVANARRRIEMEKQVTKANTDEATARQALERAKGAPKRIQEAQASRLASYEAVFDTLADEESALLELYRPLRDQVAGDKRLSRLAFIVRRSVDVDGWVERGESLVDLRRSPYGPDGLAAAVEIGLAEVWRSASSKDVRASMKSFIEQHAQRALQSLAHGYSPLDFGRWLFSIDHITVQYGIQYDRTEISRLSPGTRGVVLLTLYLALDRWDVRPLVIDQPEENLDPSSTYDDLVPFFRDAATRRQIVMVTHNANLVVNTDSDQVVVANSKRTGAKTLPDVTWIAGGLEVPEIRVQVCRLLEGGDEAFRKRGRRYGVGG